MPTVLPGLVRLAVRAPSSRRRFDLRGHSRRACELREPEVQNLHLAPLGEENVRGLDVAMDDSFRVCGIDRVRQLNAHFEQTINRQRSAVQFSVESLTLD